MNNKWHRYLKKLGVDPSRGNKGISADEIKKAWKKKVMKTHPDQGGDPEEFKAIMHAYKMLTDPSYAIKKSTEEYSPEDTALNIQVNHVISFDQAFFGGKGFISYNRVNLDKNYKPIPNPEGFEEVVCLEFEIPPGVISGHSIEFEGKGHRSGERYGSSYLNIVVQEHSKYKMQPRQKDKYTVDVISVEHIPLDVLLQGKELEIPTMWGVKTYKFQPATTPQDKICLQNYGVDNKGDHIIYIQPIFPTKDELKTEKWKGLDVNWDPEPQDEEFIMNVEELWKKLDGSDNMGPNL